MLETNQISKMVKLTKILVVIIIIATVGAIGLLVLQGGDTDAIIEDISRPFIPTTVDKTEYGTAIAAAKTAFDNGDFKNALGSYVIAYEANPKATEPFIGIARTYMKIGKPDLAEQNLIIAQKKGGLNEDGKIVLIRLHMASKNYQQAREVLQSLGSGANEALFLASIHSLLVGDIEKAQTNLANLVASATDDEYRQLGQELTHTFEVYNTFADSPRSYLLTLVGETLIDNSEFDLSRPLLFEAIAGQNDYRDAWMLIGYSYLQSHKLADAKQSLEKAKQLDPYHPVTYFYLGLTENEIGNYKDAIENLTQARSFGYESSLNIYLEIANSYFELEDYAKSSQTFRLASNEGRLPLDSYVRPIWMFIEQLNKPFDALTLAQKALQEYPEEAMALNLMGWAHLANGNLGEAQSYLDQAVAKNPNLDAAYLNLGMLHKIKGNTDVARTYLEKAIKIGRAHV